MGWRGDMVFCCAEGADGALWHALFGLSVEYSYKIKTVSPLRLRVQSLAQIAG